MKKSLIFACAAVALLASCSQDSLDLVDANVVEVQDDGTPQQIKLGTSLKASLATRGTGTVGGVYDEESGQYIETHEWDSEEFNVFMFEKGTLTLAQNPQVVAEDANGNYFVLNDKKYIAPPTTAAQSTEIDDPYADNANYSYASDGEVSYYPVQGAYDFWAYRLDGTAKGGVASGFEGNDSLYLSADGDSIMVNFAIEGDNDIMVAKATPSDAQTARMNALGAGYANQRLWSAYSARQNVHPTLTFDHMLTRFKFRVIDGELVEGEDYHGTVADATTTSVLTVDSILVFSKVDGTLKVAYTGAAVANADRVAFDDTLGLGLDLKDYDLKYYLPLKKDGADASLGYTPVAGTQATAFVTDDALMVNPGEEEYHVVFVVKQDLALVRDYSGYEATPAENPVTTHEVKTYFVEGDIKLESGEAFKQGYSYIVNATLHGLEEIILNVDIAPWINGEEANIDPEEDAWGGDPTSYAVTFTDNSTNGSVALSGVYTDEGGDLFAAEGDKLILTITPDAGYRLETLTVGGADVTADVKNGKYYYTMGAADANIEVEATFTAITYAWTAVEAASLTAAEIAAATEYADEATIEAVAVTVANEGDVAYYEDAAVYSYWQYNDGTASWDDVTATLTDPEKEAVTTEVDDTADVTTPSDGDRVKIEVTPAVRHYYKVVAE